MTNTSQRIISIEPSFNNNTYYIYNAGNLLWLIEQSNFTSNIISITINLMNDIDMKNQEINSTNFNLYNITFNGYNKKIYNLNLKNNFINYIDTNSIFKNTSFENYNCYFLISENYGTISNCKFKNAQCKLSALVKYNGNNINYCDFDEINIKILNEDTDNDYDYAYYFFGIVSGGTESLTQYPTVISGCRVKNISFEIIIENDIRIGGISGALMGGIITSCFVENIKYIIINTGSNSYYFGGISGHIMNSLIEKCSININNSNLMNIIGIVVGTSFHDYDNYNNIDCTIFKTTKDDETDDEVNIVRHGNYLSTTTNKIPSIKLIKNIERGNVTIKNIYKFNSENKISKWNYEGVIFDKTPCSIELPRINLNKSISEDNIKTIVDYYKNIIKQYSDLSIDIQTSKKDRTLYIYINEELKQASTSNNNAETFEDTSNLIDSIVIVNNLVSDDIYYALNQASISDIIFNLSNIPTTEAIVSSKPTTEAVVSNKPTTKAIVSSKPTTEAIVSSKPTTEAIVSSKPTTEAIVSNIQLYIYILIFFLILSFILFMLILKIKKSI